MSQIKRKKGRDGRRYAMKQQQGGGGGGGDWSIGRKEADSKEEESDERRE